MVTSRNDAVERQESATLRKSAASDSEIDRGPDVGRARRVALGTARLTEVVAVAPVTLGRGQLTAGLIVTLQQTGRVIVHERRRSLEVGPGMMYIGRSDVERVDLASDGPASHVVCHLPWESVRGLHPRLESCENLVHDTADPSVALLADAIRSALRHGPQLDATQRRVAQAALLPLLVLPRGDALPNDAQTWRVQRALAEILDDPTLDAARVAERQGMSRRQLDHLFLRHTGASVTARIAQTRLERAAAALRDPLQAQRSITDIALALAFYDAAHFSRAFKARYGETPSRFRAAARK